MSRGLHTHVGPTNGGDDDLDLTTRYEWDNEVRMTAIHYPQQAAPGVVAGYGHDAMGRLSAPGT